jgi:Ribose/xylose/arabinose/galactoside ABC-type transport systems, permease components
MIKNLRQIILKNNIVILLAVLFVFFSLFVGNLFLNVENLHNIVRQTSLDIPLALALTVTLITCGVDISIGSTLSMAAAITMKMQPAGTYVAVLAALLFGAAVGAVNGLLVSKGKIVPFIATLGTMTLVRGIMLTYTMQEPISGKDELFTFLGRGIHWIDPYAFHHRYGHQHSPVYRPQITQFGRNLYAVGGNPEAAFLSGIRVDRYKFYAFVISGFLAAVSGVLVASRLNSSTPHIGLDSANWAIAAAIMGGASMAGGRGNVWGSILGVISLGILVNGMNLIGVHTYYQIGIRALILLVVVIIDAISAINLRKKLEKQAYGER